MMKTISEKQHSFLQTLYREAKERVAAAPDPAQAAMQADLDAVVKGIQAFVASEGGVPRGAMDTIVTSFKSIRAPKVAAEAPSFPRPEPGYYALENGEKVRFFRVRAGKKNPHFRFLAEQASDTFYSVKAMGKVKAVFEEILADPEAAQQRYAQELGRCYVCGRTLTDEKSRALGIGPVCRGEA